MSFKKQNKVEENKNEYVVYVNHEDGSAGQVFFENIEDANRLHKHLTESYKDTQSTVSEPTAIEKDT